MQLLALASTGTRRNMFEKGERREKDVRDERNMEKEGIKEKSTSGTNHFAYFSYLI
jgi:hypothetical protein